jgi:uncharacterized membrane protein YebE (DUF533 family)
MSNESLFNRPSMVEMIFWLQDTAGQDPDIRQLVNRTLEALGVESLAAWAEDEPEMVAELYEAAKSLVDQAPIEDTISFTTARRPDEL